jgi:phosphoribosylanthranilate isomerase
MQTRIKICGITNSEDAHLAVACGANALGFILVPESPRYVEEKAALRNLLETVPPLVSCVGVCRSPNVIGESYRGSVHAAQFYEIEEKQTWHWQRGALHLIYAFRVKDETSLFDIDAALEALRLSNGSLPVSALLLDTYHQDKLGGSGETFNWELAVEAKSRFALPIILAGGLTPDNVEEAIAKVRPYAVDVSSGVETEPGKKDPVKVRAFCRAVGRANAKLDF